MKQHRECYYCVYTTPTYTHTHLLSAVVSCILLNLTPWLLNVNTLAVIVSAALYWTNCTRSPSTHSYRGGCVFITGHIETLAAIIMVSAFLMWLITSSSIEIVGINLPMLHSLVSNHCYPVVKYCTKTAVRLILRGRSDILPYRFNIASRLLETV